MTHALRTHVSLACTCAYGVHTRNLFNNFLTKRRGGACLLATARSIRRQPVRESGARLVRNRCQNRLPSRPLIARRSGFRVAYRAPQRLAASNFGELKFSGRSRALETGESLAEEDHRAIRHVNAETARSGETRGGAERRSQRRYPRRSSPRPLTLAVCLIAPFAAIHRS